MTRKIKHPYLVQYLYSYWWLTEYVGRRTPYELTRKLKANNEQDAEKEAMEFLKSRNKI